MIFGVFRRLKRYIIEQIGTRRVRGPQRVIEEARPYADETMFDTNSLKGAALSSPFIEFSTIISATNNFSDKIGAGAFGPVYKGRLPDGLDIAIKRFSSSCTLELEEFKNEVTVLSKLQHRNLVRVLGCCIHGEERMVVYEYIPNNSLESCIFDESKRPVLGWKLRYNIIQGIGKGLLYLHQDSRLYRDLKASKVLLDDDFNPKVSNSVTRFFPEEFTQQFTQRIGAVYRYLSPEYVMTGRLSEKSDVFSFGVLILEIVTGYRNDRFSDHKRSANLVGLARALWKKGSVSKLIDPLMGTVYPYDEVCRCIQVGLLCVLKLPNDRPDMPLVLRMLSGDVQLPAPKPAAFCAGRAPVDDNGKVETGPL